MTGQSKFSSQLDNLPSVYPEDVANGIISVLASPPHVQVKYLKLNIYIDVKFGFCSVDHWTDDSTYNRTILSSIF